ncbi:MAG: hypothetical protein PHX62_00145 [Bacilli bacterium]|nr:hypothetical protein [Bacilli bacterium]
MDCIYKLFFRNFFKDENKATPRNKIQANFGLDINNIIDSNIIRLCKSSEHFKRDLPLLTVDKGMQDNIKKYLPNSKWVYEQFKKTEND